MTTILAIDTTTRGGSVALAQGGVVRAVVHHDPAAGYAESLLELCDHAHQQAGLAWDLDGIAVVRGPGSFTGLRVGIMTAKTLAFARGWPLWTADTLPLLASAAGLDDAAVRIALLDAGAGHVFASALSPGAIQAEVERVALDELEGWAFAHARGAEVAVQTELAPLVRDRLSRWPVRGADSLAAALAGQASLGQPPAIRVEPEELLPLYASVSQAERLHGIDLRDRVHRRIAPSGWE